MKMIDLLNKYPNTTSIIKAWFLEEMEKSFKYSKDDVPEDFKEAMRETGISTENLASFIETQPRALFDVFDENGIYIRIHINETFEGVKFGGSLNDSRTMIVFSYRKDAEEAIIMEAFEVLEKMTLQSNELQEPQKDPGYDEASGI